MSPQRRFGSERDWSWGDATPPAASSSGANLKTDDTWEDANLRGRKKASATAASSSVPDTTSKVEATSHSAAGAEAEAEAQAQAGPGQQPQPERHYRPRTCRICLEVVQPTFEVDAGAAAAWFGRRGQVRYVSEDPELGRLISPCKCKGSQRYVHEGCLQAWRRAAPPTDQNYWSCPTCKFRYRLDRLRWGSWLSSRLTRLALTLLVCFVAVFILGFVADPIINLWVDPIGTVMDKVSEVMDDADAFREFDHEPFTWSLHFIKGILSLGLLGCVKAFLAMSPWQWWHIRSGGMLGGGGHRRGNGRDRFEGVNLALVIIGIFTFLAAVWKGVSHMSERVLEKFSDRVVDIHGDDDDPEDEPEGDENGGDGS